MFVIHTGQRPADSFKAAVSEKEGVSFRGVPLLVPVNANQEIRSLYWNTLRIGPTSLTDMSAAVCTFILTFFTVLGPTGNIICNCLLVVNH